MISVVIPFFNEKESIAPLLSRTRKTLDELLEPYEMVIIDNGSQEEDKQTLLELSKLYEIKIIQLSRNFGYQGALWAGLDCSRGDAVIFMDGDGEDPPELMTHFVAKWREGFDVVYGIRRSRQVPWWLNKCYQLFYRVLASLSDIKIPLDAGEFSLVSGKALLAMKQFQDRTRMMRIIRAWVGFRQIGIPYDRESRLAGKSKFNLFSAFSFAFDGFVAVTDMPVRLAIYCALFCFGLGIIGSFYYLLWHFWGSEKIPGFASLNITILLLFSMLFACFAILARYVITLLNETRKRPPYLVSKEITFHERK